MKTLILLLISFTKHAIGDGNAAIYYGDSESVPKPTAPRTTTTTPVPTPYQPPAPVCPDGWKSFRRVKGEWCIKVFPEKIVAGVTEEACRAQNATLTGLENAEERIYIFDESIKYIGPNDYQVTFVGGRRKGPCYADNWLSLPECTPKQTNSFWWTDRFTTGDAGWAWQTNPSQPDNSGNSQSYAGVKTTTGTWNNHYTIVGQVKGSMDDYGEGAMGAYACGRRPVTKYGGFNNCFY